MCGIVASYGSGAAELVSQALPILEHRGPDSQGSIALGPCALGMVRLAVLDPLPRADQPMSRGHINLVFNGEIYNFRQLREELFELGHVFETSGDTEVVLCAILQWGTGALSRFDGMFGMAWWDQEIDTLFAARDRYGIKPLYWRGTDGGVELASEVRALHRSESEVSRKAIAEYLVFGSPISCTIYSDAHELMPGHLLAVNGAALSMTSWLEPEPAQCERRAVTSPATALQSAIASHLVADRKVGVFLSGGFDSAIVARGIRDAGARPLAITLDTGANAIEVAGAVRTARQYGLDHHVVTVRRDDVAQLAQDFIASQDQPTIDGFNTYLVSRAAVEQGCIVALSGLGGDEVLGGYGYYSHSLARYLIRGVPKPVMAGMAVALQSATGRSASRFIALAGARTPAERFLAAREIFTTYEAFEMTGVLLPETLGLKSDRTQTDRCQFRSLDFGTYLRATLLRDSDVFSMRHGLEVRVPMLDRGFVDAAQLVNKAQLAEETADPYLIKLAAQRKQGFTLPWVDWLSELKRSLERQIDDASRPSNFIISAPPPTVRSRDVANPQRDWSLLALKTWLKQRELVAP